MINNYNNEIMDNWNLTLDIHSLYGGNLNENIMEIKEHGLKNNFFNRISNMIDDIPI